MLRATLLTSEFALAKKAGHWPVPRDVALGSGSMREPTLQNMRPGPTYIFRLRREGMVEEAICHRSKMGYDGAYSSTPGNYWQAEGIEE